MSPLDKQRLAEAESVLFLVGGYNGSGNYGDILRLASAIETAGGLPTRRSSSPLSTPAWMAAAEPPARRARHDEIAPMEGPEIPAGVRDELGRLRNLVEEARGRGDYALEVAQDMSLPTRMLAFMSWLELIPVTEGPLISIVLATRNRPHLLARAIPSVIAQRYDRWQLVIVDDGTGSATREVVADFDEERLKLAEGPRRGLGAARNVGLDGAEGDVVCYLDDDNVMHPGWLQAVAHVFTNRTDVDIAYGISIAEHRIPSDRGEHGWWPYFWQLPWSRETLLRENVTDAGCIAHRRELAEAHFDESLSTGEDWDLMLRLTQERDALALPALSHAYSMHADDRMSADPGHRAGLEGIRRRHGGD